MGRDERPITVAIVEDDPVECERLRKMLRLYSTNNDFSFTESVFDTGEAFLASLGDGYDIVFMDIQLPDLDGMEVSRRMRAVDGKAVLVFVTNFARYAINGYEVGAADFIVKPVEYDRFEAKMYNIIARIPDAVDVTIPVKTPDGTVLLGASQIKYVEIMGHWLVFHTTGGDKSAYGSLKNFEQKLTEANFLRCNSCYFVNPRYVTELKTDSVVVGGDELKISNPRRKEFKRLMTKYFGSL